MPYFYKLSESMDENGNYVKDWFIKVVYTITDFTITCDKKTSDGTIFFIFHNPPNIQKHVHDYEYVNNENVPKNKIKYISDYTFEISDINPNFEVSRFELDNLNDDSINFLLDTIHDMHDKYNNIFDELYIHITCKEYEESILRNGLSVNSGNKIGDDDDDDDEIKHQEYPSHQEQKFPSHQQYPSHQYQHNYETQYYSYPQNNQHYGNDFTDEELLDFFGGKNKIKKNKFKKIKKNKSNKIKKNKSKKIKKNKSNKIKKNKSNRIK
jgi:hypothetical protein